MSIGGPTNCVAPVPRSTIATRDSSSWAWLNAYNVASDLPSGEAVGNRQGAFANASPPSRRLAPVFVTHDLAETSALCDRCAVLDAGAVLQHERPRELFARPLTPRVAEILGLESR